MKEEDFPAEFPELHFLLTIRSFINNAFVTASAKRLHRDIGVEELVPWVWSGTNHHDISSLCPPKDSRSRGGGTVLKDALRPVPVCNC